MYDVVGGIPKKNLAAQLAKRAHYVLAVGTCACFGGFGLIRILRQPVYSSTALKRGTIGGGFPLTGRTAVINLAGCPCHCDVVAGALMVILSDVPIPLNEHNMPLNVRYAGAPGMHPERVHEYRVRSMFLGKGLPL